MITQNIDPQRVYTVQNASDLIGSSEAALIRLIKTQQIPGRIIGKGYKVLGQNLINYLDNSENLNL